MHTSVAKACLYIAITYAKKRLAVGPKGESDTPIFSYQLQQNALIPLMARTICLNIFHLDCKEAFLNPMGHEDELVNLCSIDKALTTWNLERVSSICRERCGGQGFLSCNKFGEYMTLSHTGITQDGDNVVLLMEVCKRIINNVTKKGKQMP